MSEKRLPSILRIILVLAVLLFALYLISPHMFDVLVDTVGDLLSNIQLMVLILVVLVIALLLRRTESN